jgi:hypothetical protein
MKGILPFLLLLALPAGPAYGTGKSAIVAHTFVCNGEPTQGSGPCPAGAEPDYLIQGSDGNFYGSALPALCRLKMEHCGDRPSRAELSPKGTLEAVQYSA